MDLFSLLKEDHRRLQTLIQQLLTPPDRLTESLRTGMETVADEFATHAQMEEKFLYPRMSQVGNARALIQESYSEHAQANETLQALVRAPINSDRWKQLCQQLQQALQHHVQDEETRLFPLIQQDLDVSEIDRIGREMLQFREQNLVVRPEQWT